MNARFWTFHRGDWVKITVEPGKPLETFVHTRDEEGYSLERDRWEIEDGKVINTWMMEGRDCDGRVCRSGASSCPIEELKSVDADRSLPPRPDWQKLGKDQMRDFSAEAAGY